MRWSAALVGTGLVAVVAGGSTALASPADAGPAAILSAGPTPRAPATSAGAVAADTGEVLGATAPPEVAIYPGGLGLVREARRVRLEAGDGRLAWEGAPSSLDPTSLSLELEGDATVAERVFQPRLSGQGALLRSVVGSRVTVTRSDGEVLRGTLRDVEDGILLESSDGEALLLPRDEVRLWRLEETPAAFRPSSRVVWRTRGGRAGEREATLTYLTGELSWSAEYLLRLSADERRMDLEGWADLTNGTDRSWRAATVKLVAGEISRAGGGEGGRMQPQMLRAAVAADGAGGDADVRDFAELKVYEIPDAVDLVSGQSRQVRLLSARDVPVRKRYETVGGHGGRYGRSPNTQAGIGTEPERVHARVHLRFTTDEERGIGRELPRGRVRVYQRDEDGSALLAGEDRIGDVPVGDTVQVDLGEVFDLTRERVQTDFSRPDPRSLEEAFRITLRSAMEEPVEVRVVEHLFRWHEWEILSAAVDGEPLSPTALDARRVRWTVPVPAGGSATLTYRVRYRWE